MRTTEDLEYFKKIVTKRLKEKETELKDLEKEINKLNKEIETADLVADAKKLDHTNLGAYVRSWSQGAYSAIWQRDEHIEYAEELKVKIKELRDKLNNPYNY